VTTTDQTEHFVQQLATHQNRLYGYVFSLLGDHSRAADVLQETNIVLWRKIDEFQADRAFLPWAFAIARFQVLAHLRDKKRDRLLLDAELAETISEEAARQADQSDQFREALRPCLTTLTASNRDLVERRYFREMSIAAIAEEIDRTVSAVKVALLRSRRHLLECIQRRLLAEGEA
jgi:RNA polymerase sigma-70 factor, ECF subfamily